MVLTPDASFLAASAYELIFDPFIKEPIVRAAKACEVDRGMHAFFAVWHQLSMFGIASQLHDSFRRNGSQFIYIDLKGWMMAVDDSNAMATDPADYGHAQKFDAREQFRKLKLGIESVKSSFVAQKASANAPREEAPMRPEDFLPDTPPTKAGAMLAQISKERYGTFEL